jgi:methylated-DNA-[protein]-cysteine S-methyltransferase
MEIALVPSPIGPVTIAVDDGALVQLDLEGTTQPNVDRDSAGVAECIEAYFEGEIGAIDKVLVNAAGTPFQRDVWHALRRIPPGETASYGEIAAAVGKPRAVRAVGSANANNPTALVVPCHRVIRSDGTIGGYGGGLDRKRWLLAHEAAHRTRMRQE